jgi:hypothetical protein
MLYSWTTKRQNEVRDSFRRPRERRAFANDGTTEWREHFAHLNLSVNSVIGDRAAAIRAEKPRLAKASATPLLNDGAEGELTSP